MQSLQSSNPENDIVASLAASGVPSAGMTSDERAQLANNLAASRDQADILDYALDAPNATAPQAPQPQMQYPQAAAPPPAYQPPAPQIPSGPSQQELYQALQMERSEKQQLRQLAEMGQAFQELLTEDPTLAKQFLNRLQGAPSVDETGQPVDNQTERELRMMRRQMQQIATQNERLQRQQEAYELQQAMPGMFNPQATEQYRQAQNFKSMKDAYIHQLGSTVMGLIQAQRQQQQYQQQYQPQQGNSAQWQGQQQPQQQPQQWVQQQPAYNQYSEAPPAHNAQIMRPGAASVPGAANPNLQAIQDFRPKNESQLKAKIRAYAQASGMNR